LENEMAGVAGSEDSNNLLTQRNLNKLDMENNAQLLQTPEKKVEEE
jgi:hypothetical protein